MSAADGPGHRRRSTRRPLAAINVTPLVDVLLILLVIVMLAMPAFVKSLPLQLPRVDTMGAPQVRSSVRVYLTEQGKLLVDEVPATLEQALDRARPGVSVEVAADRRTPYQQVASLLAALQARSPRDVTLLVN